MSLGCRNSFFIFIFSFILLMSVQTILFQNYSGEATWLYFKEMIGAQTAFDRKQMAGICNSLARTRCSVRFFRKLVRDHPGDPAMLSNLAMALTRLKKEQEAFPYFSAYFSTGGSAKDVMLSYVSALKNSGQSADALQWLYRIVYEDPHDIQAARVLISTLVDLDRSIEALSFLASLIDHNRNDETSELWFSEIKKLDQQKRDYSGTVSAIETSTDSVKEYGDSSGHVSEFVGGSSSPMSDQFAMGSNYKKDQIKLPALDGHRFFIPFRTTTGDFQFIVAANDEDGFQINQKDFLALGWSHTELGNGRVHIPRVNIGDLTIHNFELKVCEDCESWVGSDFLTNMGAYVDARGRVPYLILENKEKQKWQ